MSGQRNTPRGPSQCYVWKQLFSLQVQLPLNNLPSYPPRLESNNPQPPRARMFRAVPTQQEQSHRKGWDGSKRCDRQEAKQTLFVTKTQCTSAKVSPSWAAPAPARLGTRPWLGSTQVGGRLGLLHNTGVLTRTRPGTVFCKIFGNGSPKLNLRPSVWKCPIGKLETPQREQTTTDRPAPAASRKHFRRKSSGPTIASHVDVTCPPEVWGRALEAPARALLVVGRSGR